MFSPVFIASFPFVPFIPFIPKIIIPETIVEITKAVIIRIIIRVSIFRCRPHFDFMVRCARDEPDDQRFK